MRDESLRFAQKLLAKTDEGKLNWEATYDSNTFICVLGGDISFTIERSRANEYILEMKDETDQLAFRESLRAPDQNTSTRHDEHYRLLANLYEKARRAALQLDKKIANAERLLDSL